MKISEDGINKLKNYEGLKLKAYPDPVTGAEPWTIGYGHTKGVEPGQVITMQQAEEYLHQDLIPVYAAIQQLVKVPLTQGQFDALCSFIFNLGIGNFAHSTLLKKLNTGDYQSAAKEFVKWDHADGKAVAALRMRRESEQKTFLS
ncbi:lysozyme [Xenorhabdus griffiniae]|uniref:Lysozyme n=1 Tax=Xenorhabdus griffiniae TaxID=351672 RepID=A0ABY9XLK9_9GAMM|nr:lysozyme [Xenorhabdus griffiniae]MBD1226229.1 lysozyme [Xenorhabdus griffiniae]MBE8586425.1 lysozyme [Xenorhabdus griffiniae]MDC9605883.1 lysozyme [Xenorhabdus griffiniae]WMV73822.1 lysozyme [Xenorhabdus griffiniae]WNH03503.1 lysozyme [Xenorhabdus griffiniae]